MVEEELATQQEPSGLPAGAILATAVTAGFIAFMIRRSNRRESAADLAAARLSALADSDFRARTAAATKDFVLERITPEIKPLLLDLLKDLKGYVDQAFDRAEKTIKRW